MIVGVFGREIQMKKETFDKKKKINLILNLGSQKNYLRNKAYLGSTCGRFANRIRNASFVLNKKKILFITK